MVITPATAKINLEVVPYFKGKGPQINAAATAAVEQLSHAQMVATVTKFIDGLIQSGVKELATAADDGSDTAAQQKAQGNLDKYVTDEPNVDSFKNEVADKLAQNIYVVKQLLIDGGLANQRGDTLTFKAEDGVFGKDIVFESVQELAEQTLASIHTKLSAYGIKVNAEEAAQLKQVITRELKNPPKPKSEATPRTSSAAETSTTTPISTEKPATASENTTAENSNTSIINDLKEKQNKLAKQLMAIPEIQIFLNQKADQNQESGMSQLRTINQKIIENESVVNNGTDLTSAFKTFQDNLKDNIQFIQANLSKGNFLEEFNKLTDDQKIQVGILLKNIEITVDEKTMVDLTGRITGQLGENTKKNLQTRLTHLINEFETPANSQDATAASTLALNLNKANEYLEQYNGALKEIENQKLPTPKEIVEKQKATNKFLEQIQESLKDNTLSIEEVKIIAKSLTLKNEERKSGKASPAIDNIFGRFIDSMKEKGQELGIEITEEGLKQFAGTAVVLAIGAALFCPNLVGNLTKGAFSLGTMLTQTILPLYQNMNQNAAIAALAENNQKSK
jgi:hypothetical protein